MKKTIFSLVFAVSSISLAKEISIVGTWKTKVKQSPRCIETHTYKADGTLFILSGTEKTEQTYKLEPVPLEPGIYKITSTVTKDSGGTDCANSKEDLTGKTATIYVSFSPDEKAMIHCFTKQDKCFAVYTRQISPQ